MRHALTLLLIAAVTTSTRADVPPRTPESLAERTTLRLVNRTLELQEAKDTAALDKETSIAIRDLSAAQRKLVQDLLAKQEATHAASISSGNAAVRTDAERRLKAVRYLREKFSQAALPAGESRDGLSALAGFLLAAALAGFVLMRRSAGSSEGSTRPVR